MCTCACFCCPLRSNRRHRTERASAKCTCQATTGNDSSAQACARARSHSAQHPRRHLRSLAARRPRRRVEAGWQSPSPIRRASRCRGSQVSLQRRHDPQRRNEFERQSQCHGADGGHVPATIRRRGMRISFEREVTLRSGQVLDVDVSLNPAPEPPPPPPPPPAAAPEPATQVGPKGQVQTISIPDWLEKEFVGREPRRETIPLVQRQRAHPRCFS